MIILDPSEAVSHDERTPLKKTASLGPAIEAFAAAPPPYGSVPTAVVPSYQAVQRPTSPPSHALLSPAESTFKRFIKAFCVAVLVLVLWGTFFDTIGMTVARSGGYWHQYNHKASNWVMDTWIKAPTQIPTCKECLCVCDPHGEQTPGRALPINYPPVLPRAASAASTTFGFLPTVPLSEYLKI
ncbi:hypothetical protein B0H34DRAFT_381768 [Crassisporium funariophilum]|nr:hypothetical protein B0H34DRAFT_381768 [Crassisporium funariophilum]